ncbi:hypothetical protein [Aegicerativicinus sediminis]|uniref:hypothetical protein n=1 Tax=Aegicerativicinus sediminis TaxID=2893202 RepID=UPI001E3A6C76|nr:hypothetical protein [Aegicerativicinus sediminis]
MGNKSAQQMKPQDIVLLSKLIALESPDYTQMELAQTLYMSQSEISSSIARSSYAGLLINKGTEVNRRVFFDFIQYGLHVVFPQNPGPVVRGTLTAHSAPPLTNEILSEEYYVWPYAKGRARGQSILPLYPTVPQAVELDPVLYEILALLDAVRVGWAREKNLALRMLEQRIC